MSQFAKRLFDLTFVLMFSPLIVSVFLVCCLCLILGPGRPILFKQQRLGQNHKVFNLWKLRTMTNEVDCKGALLPDGQRITRIGSFMRSTSLDELPGFFNVLVGDMSVVGPRPLPVHYKHRYSAWQDRRHLIKPGVTGWAQINGRNEISWSQKFELDLWYVNNSSLWVDIKIIMLTVRAVITRRGINQTNGEKMEEFEGE